MKVLFIYPNIRTGNGPHFNHGVAMLSAVLKRAGHSTRLIALHEPPGRDSLLAEVKEFDPGLVGFSFGSHQWRHVRQIADWLLESHKVPTIAGGPHATHAPDQTLEHPGIDMVCRGEGEGAILELVEALEAGQDIASIPNLWVRTMDGVIRNDVRPLDSNLDSLPFSESRDIRHA